MSHTHTPLHHSQETEVTMNYNVSMLIQTQRKILFIFFKDVICLKFLDQKYLLQLLLNCENSCVFPSKKDNALFPHSFGYHSLALLCY